MKLSKWVDMGQEVEIEIGMEDIRCALSECFSKITSDRLGEKEANQAEISMAFNILAEFLRAITDRHIDTLTHAQRAVIEQFLKDQSKRYVARGIPA